MNLTMFVCMLFILQVFYWIVGRYSSKKISNQDDYFLAGKSVSFFPLMMTFIGAIVGGGLVLGSAEEAFKFGWPVIFYPVGGGLGLIILGMGIGRRLAEFPVSTIAQICEIVYRSSLLKKAASILSIVSLFMVLVAQILASSKFLVSLGINNTPLFLVFWAIIILYTVQGGLKAVISTDAVQAVIFMAVFFLCFAYVLFHNPELAWMPTLETSNIPNLSHKLAGWLLMPLLFMIIEQDVAQRCFAGSSTKVVSRAAFMAGIGCLAVSIVPVFFGMIANSLKIAVPEGGSVLMSSIMATTNPTLSSLVGCAVLAAIISTATALINAISSNVASDFNLMCEKSQKSVRLVRKITSIISITAIAFAFYFENIVNVLIQSYELSVSCLFVPVITAVLRKKGNFLSALLAMSFGALGFVALRIYPIEFPRELASIALSFLGYFSGELVIYYFQNEKYPAEASN